MHLMIITTAKKEFACCCKAGACYAVANKNLTTLQATKNIRGHIFAASSTKHYSVHNFDMYV
jgi:hypothetical protein